jgi:hypothetical protein
MTPGLLPAVARAAALPARARNGRPGRITARAATAATAATITAVIIGGTPAAPADITAAVVWAALTSIAELAPPPAPAIRSPP